MKTEKAQKVNENFDVTAQKEFLNGAKIAYETIITDFSDNDNKIIAIAGELAAEKYGLDILSKNIEDYSNNTTRFLTIGNIDSSKTSLDKTSIMATTKNEEGALYSLLEPFNRLGINLSHLTYRPSKINKWQYSFFIDFDGHKEDKLVQDLLNDLLDKEIEVKILGSYPKAIG